MKKLILILACMFTLTGCTLELRSKHCGPGTNLTCGPVYTDTASAVSVSEYYYDGSCWDEPYWHAAEWCDWYNDNTVCCVWYIDGWFEEWCQWEDDICWDYNGSF